MVSRIVLWCGMIFDALELEQSAGHSSWMPIVCENGDMVYLSIWRKLNEMLLSIGTKMR